MTRNFEEKITRDNKLFIQVITNGANWFRLLKTIKCLEDSDLCRIVLNPYLNTIKPSSQDSLQSKVRDIFIGFSLLIFWKNFEFVKF